MKCYACGSENVEKKDNNVQCLEDGCGQAFEIKQGKAKPSKSQLEKIEERLSYIEGKTKRSIDEDIFPV